MQFDSQIPNFPRSNDAPKTKLATKFKGLVEPSFLVSKDGGRIVKVKQEGEQATKRVSSTKNGSKRLDLTRKNVSVGVKRQDISTKNYIGLRRIYGGGSRRVAAVFECRQEKVEANVRKGRRAPSLTERLSFSNSNYNSDPATVRSNPPALCLPSKNRQGGPHRRLSQTRSLQRTPGNRGYLSLEDDLMNQKASLIQANVRKYYRTKGAEKGLLRKLQEIKRKKQEELASIEANKHQEMNSLLVQCTVEPLTQATQKTWRSKSKGVTQLITKVRTARDRNSKLNDQIVRVRSENKRLAIENSLGMTQASNEELRVNRLERCGLQLHEVARTYGDALLTGRRMLREFDDDSGFNLEEMTDEQSDRFGEIKQMIALAKQEDDCLI